MQRKVIFLVTLAVFSVVAVLMVLAIRPAPHRLDWLQLAVVSAAERDKDNCTIKLGDIANFTWDQVYMFSPYTTLEQVREELGFRWSPLSPAAECLGGEFLLAYDSRFLIVFVDDGLKVTGWHVFNMDASVAAVFVDFPSHSHVVMHARENAVFCMEELLLPGDGKAWKLKSTR